LKLFIDFLSLPGHRRLLALALAASLTMVGALGAVVWATPGGAAPWLVGVLVLAGLVLTWVQFHAVMQHLMEREYERQALEQSEGAMREALQALPVGIAVYDSHDRLMLFNAQAAEMAPLRYGDELIGQTFEGILRRALERGTIPEAWGREEEWLRERLAARGQLDRPLLRPSTDGRWMHLYEIGTPSGGLVAARLDVTALVQKSLALERSNQQLEQLSATDGLTGLANRRQFDQHLYDEWQRSLRTGLPLSLLMIDIDHFKRYNDRHGHLAGDACLRQVASLLYDCAQRAGELVARYGGEEFALLLPGADAEAARAVARRCMDELAKASIPHGDSPVGALVTCSIGVATVVAHAELVPESLVRCADDALYQVKSSGRANFVQAPCPA
jgi:diguanylate cyclase (GGDEF)-like protein